MYVLAGYAQRRDPQADGRVLLLDADPMAREMLLSILREAGHAVDPCSTPERAFEALAEGQHRVLVTQHGASLLEGSALARHVQRAYAGVSIILLTGDPALDTAVAALQAGVFDFMSKSFPPAELPGQLRDALMRTLESEREVFRPGPPLSVGPARDPVQEVLVGECAAIEQARAEVRAALNDAAPVLICGEAGTEKLSVARLLHDASERHAWAFVVVNAPPAQGDAPCSVDLDGQQPGTLFFSEVSVLDAGWQVELVRQLSDLGAGPAASVPRLIGGLNLPAPASWEGSVVARLFAGLGARRVQLPPLRERGRDALILAEHFAEQVRLARGDASLRISSPAIDALARHAWPGNVQELRFAIQHAASLCVDSAIGVADLPPSISSVTLATDERGTRLLVQSLEEMELAYILRVLEAVGGNKASAARLLGVDRTTLYRKLQRQEQSGPSVGGGPGPTRRLRK